MRGELYRTVMVYVDSYVNSIPTGRFHIASAQETQPFQSLNQLLIEVNRTMDQKKFPQSFYELRTFHAPKSQEDPPCETDLPERGAVATFSIRILFRQNATWQGAVTWIEGHQEVSFRSVLELIFLMDNALSYSKRT